MTPPKICDLDLSHSKVLWSQLRTYYKQHIAQIFDSFNSLLCIFKSCCCIAKYSNRRKSREKSEKWPPTSFLKTYARWHLEATPESVLGRFVELHEADVGAVPEEEGEGLPPLDLVVQEEDDQHDERDRVEEDVPDERPGCQAEKKEQP